MKNRISIVISCFNDSAFVGKAVQSSLDQTYQNKEIIIVDDGSDKQTKLMLKSLEPIVKKLITQENKGVSSARNRGIKEASGDLILVLDSDDYFDPSFCEKAARIMKINSEVKIVTCHAQRFSEKGMSQIIRTPTNATLKEFLLYNHAIGNSLFRKRDFLECGGYDEAMIKGYEDWEFFIRLLKNGGHSVAIPEVLFYYRQKEISKSTRANEIKYELLQGIYIKHKELYIENYEGFVNYFLERLRKVEEAERKNLQTIDFRLGKVILDPMRLIKRIIKF